MLPARETTLTLFVVKLSLLKQKSYAGHNFDILRHILIMFGRNKEEGQ